MCQCGGLSAKRKRRIVVLRTENYLFGLFFFFLKYFSVNTFFIEKDQKGLTCKFSSEDCMQKKLSITLENWSFPTIFVLNRTFHVFVFSFQYWAVALRVMLRKHFFRCSLFYGSMIIVIAVFLDSFQLIYSQHTVLKTGSRSYKYHISQTLKMWFS